MPESEKKPTLFSSFNEFTAADWAAKVQQDLKGENPDTLMWQTAEGLIIKPCYHPEDTENNKLTNSLPGEYPFARGFKTETNNWQNIQEIQVGDDTVAAIKKGARVLTQGADGLHFNIEKPEAFQPEYLIQEIDLLKYPVNFTVAWPATAFLAGLITKLKEQNIPLEHLQGYIYVVPAAIDQKYTPSYFDELQALLALGEASPNFYAVTVNGVPFAAAGGTIVQEIAFTISSVVAHLDELTNRGIAPETVARNMQLQLATGTNYFFEIAKLRAIRVLWATVCKAFGLSPDVAASLRIHCQTSRWYQTTFDPHTNLFRATTEAMAAVTGGCNSLSVSSFDSTIQPENEFSERLARNLSLILREEAYLHHSIDPAAGSYYLENLTSQLTNEARQLFQDLETQGGFIKAWQNNYIKDALHEVAQEKFKRISSGQDILVGTNKFIHPNEKINFDPEVLIQSSYFDTTRASYPLEVMRFAVDLHYRKRQQKPVAIIASIGEAIQRHINASFAQEFFTCAGFQTSVQHFESVAEAETALKLVATDLIVMSASEQEYETFARHFGPALRQHPDKPALILAANPHHMKEELVEQGFDAFLFHGCDTAAIVSRIRERLLTND